jgi:ketosteroid isomerase-like protein
VVAGEVEVDGPFAVAVAAARDRGELLVDARRRTPQATRQRSARQAVILDKPVWPATHSQLNAEIVRHVFETWERGDLKRCTNCEQEKGPAEFSRDRSRKDGRAPWCKACVRRWQQEHADYMADYHRRWQQANRDKKRAQDRRYRERKREDPDYRERRRAQDRRYRERKRARISRTS